MPISTVPAPDGPQQTPGLAPNLTDYRPWLPVGAAVVSVENSTAPFASNPMTLRLKGAAAVGPGAARSAARHMRRSGHTQYV